MTISIEEILIDGIIIKEVVRIVEGRIEKYYFNHANNKCSFFIKKIL